MPTSATSGTARLTIFVASGMFVALMVGAWLRPLALPDEGRYVGIALEMVLSGDWLVPTLDTLPHFHKPPLFYWLTGASLATFGINEWAARLASLLAACGSAFAVFLFVRRFVAQSQAWLTLLVLVTTPFFFGGAQFANLDMLVTACVACTVLCAAGAVLAADGDRPRRWPLAGAYGFAALGCLAKGLIGAVIPGLVIVAWLVVTGKRAMILRLVWLPGLALFLLIVVPWFALVEARYPGFLTYFFIHHHFERFVTREFNSHEPFWFYLPIFAVATLPWSLFLLPAVRKPQDGDGLPAQVHSLMWLWLAITLVFFSIPASKLIGYVLIAVPPFAVLAADGLARFSRARGEAQRRTTSVAGVAMLLCAAAFAAALAYKPDHTKELAAAIRPLLKSEGGQIVALHNYPFSLPFYLRRRQAMRVVENWSNARLLEKDSWPRELHEAATFAPARARAVLGNPESVGPLLACSSRPVWIIASKSTATAYPELARLQPIGSFGQYTVWRSTPSPAAHQRSDCGP